MLRTWALEVIAWGGGDEVRGGEVWKPNLRPSIIMSWATGSPNFSYSGVRRYFQLVFTFFPPCPPRWQALWYLPGGRDCRAFRKTSLSLPKSLSKLLVWGLVKSYLIGFPPLILLGWELAEEVWNLFSALDKAGGFIIKKISIAKSIIHFCYKEVGHSPQKTSRC